MPAGYLALVLHAHLPFVRHPEYEDALEENWLYQAVAETYVPLLLVLERLVQDGIDFRLTFSLTPTLASMFADPLLQSRCAARLGRTVELAEKEIARNRARPEFQSLARMYRALFADIRAAYVDRYRCGLTAAFRRFQDLGKIEIVASAATHGYLPLLAPCESAVRMQVRVGVAHYREALGREPRGFWLPECGFYPGVDRVLRRHGIAYTILETHGVTRADPRPEYGVYAPVQCESGVAAFARDPESSRQVWSSVEGYPGDYDYREFYRDIGYDLDLDYIGPYIHRDGIRIDTGMKYYRVTGPGGRKEPYVPERAARKARQHAAHFVAERTRQVRALAPAMRRKPLVVAPYDAELLGHWWFEGPRWLDSVIREIARNPGGLELVTLSEYLEEYPRQQISTPSASSWGHGGSSEVWLNPKNDWIYPQLHGAARAMEELTARHDAVSGPARRALRQAARELLLAQASDWAFMIDGGTTDEYAARRVKTHLAHVHKLREQIGQGAVDEAWLGGLESRDNIFPHLTMETDFPPPAADAPSTSPAPPARRASEPTAPLRIAMISPEAAPFAKTGGLADMVTSLARELGRLGHEVSIYLPAYRGAGETALPNVHVHLVRADRYFDRPYLYGTPDADYPDNAERFAWFCRAALEALRQAEPPHILQAHDWQAAPAVAFLKAQPRQYPELAAVKSVFTVHNAGYQGLFDAAQWPVLNLDREFFTPHGFEFYGRINFLKAGVVFADAVATVSPSYAREIQTPEHGFGLEGVFQRRAARLVGILNGADYEVWDPATDGSLAANYTPAGLRGKAVCKADLQRRFGLAENPDVPLLAMVTRLVDQKGLDLVAEALDRLLARNLQFVLLGTGLKRYEELFRALPARYPGTAAVRIEFDEAAAHRIEAGADLFLMPSRYEPSGLNQLYSLRYGTIPIVRSTGGLRDSVENFDPATGRGTGFAFEAYTGAALLEAVDRALSHYGRRPQWNALMRRAMQADFGWRSSAERYVELYREILAG